MIMVYVHSVMEIITSFTINSLPLTTALEPGNITWGTDFSVLKVGSTKRKKIQFFPTLFLHHAFLIAFF